jgi:hypothetical protein
MLNPSNLNCDTALLISKGLAKDGLASKAGTEEHSKQPYRLAIRNDELYLTDGLNGSISKLNSSCKMLGRYGSSGKSTGQFLIPHAIAVSSTDKLFVGETINWSVQ